MLLQRLPGPPLDAVVERFWLGERAAQAHARERILPTGHANLVLVLRQRDIVRYDSAEADQPWRCRGGALQGPHAESLVRGGTDEASLALGAQFTPGGAAALFGVPMDDLAGRTVALHDLLGSEAEDLLDRLAAPRTHGARLAVLEAWLRARLLRRAQAPDALMTWAAARFANDPAWARVAPIQHASGLSPARFIARFRQAVGLTPKRYARVLRFQRALALIPHEGRTDWAALALEAGYGDQAHLAHEFRRCAGIAPTAYRPLSADQPNHVAVMHRPARP